MGENLHFRRLGEVHHLLPHRPPNPKYKLIAGMNAK